MKISWPDLNLPPINLLTLGKEDSPCQGRCSSDGNKCTGCLRTLDEIADWAIYDPHERWTIIKRVYDENPVNFSKKLTWQIKS